MSVRLALTLGLLVATEAQTSCSDRYSNECNSDQYCHLDQQECRTIVRTINAAALTSHLRH